MITSLNDIFYNEEEKMLMDLVRSFITRDIVPRKDEVDGPCPLYAKRIIPILEEIGLFDITLPAAHQGAGMEAAALVPVMEEISAVDPGTACILLTNSMALEIIMEAAEDGPRGLLDEEIRGRDGGPVAMNAFSHPDECVLPGATLVDGIFFLEGTYDYCVLGGETRRALIPALLDGSGGCSYFLVDLCHKNAVRSDPVPGLGMNSCPAVDIELRGVPGLLAGSVSKGGVYFENARVRMAPAMAAVSLGILRSSYACALGYALERLQGGRKIIEWPEVRMMLSRMAISLRVASVCVEHGYRLVRGNSPEGASRSPKGGQPLSPEGASRSPKGGQPLSPEGTSRSPKGGQPLSPERASRSPKGGQALSPEGACHALALAIHTGELAYEAAVDGVQILGGNGYMKDYQQEKRMRDAKQAQCLMGMHSFKKLDYFEMIQEQPDNGR